MTHRKPAAPPRQPNQTTGLTRLSCTTTTSQIPQPTGSPLISPPTRPRTTSAPPATVTAPTSSRCPPAERLCPKTPARRVRLPRPGQGRRETPLPDLHRPRGTPRHRDRVQRPVLQSAHVRANVCQLPPKANGFVGWGMWSWSADEAGWPSQGDHRRPLGVKLHPRASGRTIAAPTIPANRASDLPRQMRRWVRWSRPHGHA